MAVNLYLIFHGPWGFYVTGTPGNPARIQAAAPYVSGHTYQIVADGSPVYPAAGQAAAWGKIAIIPDPASTGGYWTAASHRPLHNPGIQRPIPMANERSGWWMSRRARCSDANSWTAA